MRKAKHTKIRNTGILFELLLRQMTSDILDKREQNNALKIVKHRFNEKTELGKELALYNAIINEKFTNDRKADHFITEILKCRQELNNSKLRREKYNVIKEIQDNFDTQRFLSSKLDDYKLYATVYQLFEHYNTMKPIEKTQTYFFIIENLTKPKPVTKFKEIVSESQKLNGDERLLAYKILLEKFNNKYTKLDNSQKKLLKEYINNVSNTSNLTEHLSAVIPKLQVDLKKMIPSVEEKVVKIKLTEAIKSMSEFCNVDKKSKVIKDSAIVQTLRYMELLKELRNNAKQTQIIN
jgi:hypothetical protein